MVGTVKVSKRMTADSQVERLSCGAGCRMVLLYYFRVRSGLFGIPPSCPSTPHHSLVRPQSVLGMALTTGTDLLGEIDGSKVEAANRCYYAAAVTPPDLSPENSTDLTVRYMASFSLRR